MSAFYYFFFTARISFSLQSHSVGGKTPCLFFLVLTDARNCRNVINVVKKKIRGFHLDLRKKFSLLLLYP